MSATAVSYTACGSRSVLPSELVGRVSPLLACAGVTRLANITGLDRLEVPVVLAVRPAATTLSVSAGKGITLEDATISAAMEAVELYCAETTALPTVTCTAAALGREAHPIEDGLPLRAHAIPPDKDRRTRWTPGVDLSTGETCMLPVDAVSLSVAGDSFSPYLQTSNGLASGAVLGEAVLAGLLEVVERDALAVWRRSTASAVHDVRRVRLETLRDVPIAAEIVEQLLARDVQPLIYDCTSDTHVPTYMVRLVDLARRNVGVFSGSGAHLDPQVALVRALTEAAQSRAVYLAGSRDDLTSREFSQLRAQDSPSVIARLLAQPAHANVRHCTCSETTIEAQLETVLERCLAIGMTRIVVVDLTPSAFESQLSVVRVIVPGMFGRQGT